jgi:hypothetical protein
VGRIKLIEVKEQFPPYLSQYGGVGNERGRERINRIKFHIICGRYKGVLGTNGGIPPMEMESRKYIDSIPLKVEKWGSDFHDISIAAWL